MTETLAQRTGVCSCCEGIAESTPAKLGNPPGLSSLAYRVGTHGRFKETMLTGLSRHDALRRLTTGEHDDPTIALIDAWAIALDVLTFYQERIANEGFLQTALEQRSIRELAREIGYELGPGVAAETRLAFELETAPGAPESALFPVGTKVQSVPGQNELPQTFETVEEFEARPEWTALRARTLTSVPPASANELYLAGTSTNLRVGDRILLVAKNGDWATHRLTSLHEDLDSNATRVEWTAELGWSGTLVIGPQTEDFEVFALRARASLFGHNAPDWTAMPLEVKTAYDGIVDPDPKFHPKWPNLSIAKVGRGTGTDTGTNGNRIFLDTIYPDVVTGSWVLLRAPDLADALFEVTFATEAQRTDFTMSAKSTRLDLEVPYQGAFDAFDPYLRETTVFGHSEKLALAEWPVRQPVWGFEIDLAEPVSPLPEGRHVIVTGLPAYATPSADSPMFGWWIDPGDGAYLIPALPGEVFRVVSVSPAGNGLLWWQLDDGKGKSGRLLSGPDALVTVEPPDDATTITESAVTAAPAAAEGLQDTLTVASSLEHTYHRPSVRIAANVARATHGESRKEILGGGDGSVAFQRFALKDEPLTYIQSAGATGAATTLSVRIGGVLWQQVRSLYGHGPRERVYVVRIDDQGIARIEFGDGITGARLPTAVQNVKATYRVGTGLPGNVGAGRLTMLVGAPLGVKAVTNPLPATGGADPETGERARRNAPLTVLAFDRIVSLDDAEDFAAAFAGVGKAQAARLWNGEAEIVHLTIAGANGKPPSPGEPLLQNLRDAVKSYGDPYLRVQIDPCAVLPFAVEATVFVLPEYEPKAVIAALRAALADAFSFERRSFAQSAALSEVVAAAQNVEGVEGIDLLGLHLVGDDAYPNDLLVAEPARFSGGTILPAQLLTLASENVAVTAA